MFSGIVEEAAKVVKLEKDKGNLHITMECSFVNELKRNGIRTKNACTLVLLSIGHFDTEEE